MKGRIELQFTAFKKKGFPLSETLKIANRYFRPNFGKIIVSPKLKPQKWDLFRFTYTIIVFGSVSWKLKIFWIIKCTWKYRKLLLKWEPDKGKLWIIPRIRFTRNDRKLLSGQWTVKGKQFFQFSNICRIIWNYYWTRDPIRENFEFSYLGWEKVETQLGEGMWGDSTWVSMIHKCDVPRENASEQWKLLITEFKVKSCFAYISWMPQAFWIILVPKWTVVDRESKNIVLGSINVFRLFIFVFPKITVKRSVNTGGNWY